MEGASVGHISADDGATIGTFNETSPGGWMDSGMIVAVVMVMMAEMDGMMDGWMDG